MTKRHTDGATGWMGIVRQDALLIRELQLLTGQVTYLATYETNSIEDGNSTDFDSDTGDEAARFMIDGGVFRTFEHPVASGAALANNDKFELGSYSV